MWPLLIGLLGVGAVGSQVLGGDALQDAAGGFGEAVGPVIASTVSGTHSALIAAIRGNEVEVFTALTVLALSMGAYTYGRALLSR